MWKSCCRFFYSLPTSSRHEERNEDGDVKGSYSFVAPEGDEFDFQYQADKKGFRVQSDSLPEVPEDTEEVKKAKEEFFELYKKALELVSSSEGDEESEEDSEEDSDEDDDDHEESSEESSEGSEEDDEDDEDDEDEEEEEKGKEEEKEKGKGAEEIEQKKSLSSRPRSTIKKPVFVSQVIPPKDTSNKKRGNSSFKRPQYNSSLPPKKLSTRQASNSFGNKVNNRKSYYYAN